MTATEIREKLTRLHTAAHQEKRAFKPEEQGEWDRLLADYKRQQELGTIPVGDVANDPFGGKRNIDSGTKNTGKATKYWTTREGRKLPVFGKEDRLGAHYGNDSDFSFGRYFRAKILAKLGDDNPWQGAKFEREVMEARALDTDATDGGEFVPSPVSTKFIDLFRDPSRNSLVAAGAQTIMMDTNTLDLARTTTDVPMAYTAEGSTNESDPQFDNLTLTGKTIRGSVLGSRELLADAVNIAEALETMFADAAAETLVSQFLEGGGGAGLTGLETLTSVNESAAVGTPTWVDILTGMKLVLEDDARPNAVWAHSRDWNTLWAQLGTANDHFINPPQPVQALIDAGGWYTANDIDTAGGGSTNESSIYVGDGTKIVIGPRSAGLLEIDTAAKLDAYQFRAGFSIRVEAAAMRPTAFARLIGVNT